MRMRLLALIATFLTWNLTAADWPCWRGADGLGVSAETKLPSEWSKEKNIAWSIALPGKGASSPIVVGERVYVTTQTPDTGLHLLAIERESGTIIWNTEIGRGSVPSNKTHNMATPTPVSDGAMIWALFGTGDVAAVNREGKVIWRRDLIR